MSTSYISTRYVHSDQILGPWTYYYGFQLRMGAGIDWFSPLILLSMYILTQIATSALRYLVKATFRTRCNAGVCRLRCRCVTPESFKGILLRGTYAFCLWATQHGSTKLRLDANQTRSWWGEPLVSAQKVWVSIRSSSIGLRITVCIVGLILTCSGVIGTGMMLQS